MSTFQENLTILQNLLQQSAGKPVHYGNETYRFTQQAKVTEEELASFEQQYNVRLPEDFKTFLLTLGACTLFEDERGFSDQFYAPDQWESYAKEVFEGTDQFGVFYSDVPPEEWEEDTDLMPFSQWLEEEMEICKG